jgi:hypothetical protein
VVDKMSKDIWKGTPEGMERDNAKRTYTKFYNGPTDEVFCKACWEGGLGENPEYKLLDDWSGWTCENCEAVAVLTDKVEKNA